VQLAMTAKCGGKHDEVPHDANGSDAETICGACNEVNRRA
jgi:hypothetical protein